MCLMRRHGKALLGFPEEAPLLHPSQASDFLVSEEGEQTEGLILRDRSNVCGVCLPTTAGVLKL